MAKPYALFVAIPAIGHLNPLLIQGQELERRGWRVAFASLSSMGSYLSQRGVDFVDLGPDPTSPDEARAILARVTLDPSFIRSGLNMVRWSFAGWPTLYDGLAHHIAADRPDVAIVDLHTTAGVDAAEAAGVPFVVNNPDVLAVISSALLPPAPSVPLGLVGRSIHQVNWWHRASYRPHLWLARRIAALTLGRELNALRRSRGRPPVDVNTRLRGATIMVNSAFPLEYSRPLPAHICMVGPMLERDPAPPRPDLAAWLMDGPPVVYVNLGTLAEPGQDLLARLAAGLGAGEHRTLWVSRDPPEGLPADARLERWLPSQLGLLSHPNVRAFVSHCGINSAHESIAADTPIVGVPLFADQEDMAIRVVDAGVGLRLDKLRFTPDELRAAVERALGEPGFRERMAPLQAAFRQAGGAARAADLIEQAAKLATPRPPV